MSLLCGFPIICFRIEKENLKAGDHIYSWRATWAYAHHGAEHLVLCAIYSSFIRKVKTEAELHVARFSENIKFENFDLKKILVVENIVIHNCEIF